MRAICLLSGGMDSATVAYLAKSQGYEILALHLNYGQRTETRERTCAKRIAARLHVTEFCEISLDYLTQFGASSLTDQKLSVDSFDSQRGGIPNTYVPFRNGNLLAIATSFAEARDAHLIFLGVQALDYSGYPDCRPQFIEAFQRAIDEGTRETTHIQIKTPFINMTKREILTVGMGLGVPYEETWSCYKNQEKACGTCGACHFRLEAFSALGIRDPVDYEI